MYDEYIIHCKEALETYGDCIASTIATEAHFNTWLRERKADVQDTLRG